MTNTNELTAKLKAAAKDAADNFDPVIGVLTRDILALTEALEAAEKRYENRTPTEWAYDQACAAIEKHRARADAAEARIAELEARTFTVKLPPYSFFDFKLGSHHASGAYVNLEAMNKELAKAGIKLQIEGE